MLNYISINELFYCVMVSQYTVPWVVRSCSLFGQYIEFSVSVRHKFCTSWGVGQHISDDIFISCGEGGGWG